MDEGSKSSSRDCCALCHPAEKMSLNIRSTFGSNDGETQSFSHIELMEVNSRDILLNKIGISSLFEVLLVIYDVPTSGLSR